MKTIALSLILAAAAFAQGSPVNITSDPPPAAVVSQFFYDASNNLQYICKSPQRGPTSVQKRTDSTLTSIAYLTSTTATVTTASAHGLYVGARVTVSGATVDTDLNGTTTVLTVPSSTTYTITIANVANATYTESTLVVTTTYPLLTAPKWAIQAFTYNGSNYLTGSYFANASTGYGLACTDRATY